MMDGMRLYRISRYFYEKKIYIVSRFLDRVNNLLRNSHIPSSAKIGKNSSFAYGGIGMVIHSKSIIGENCMIGQGCTIGGKSGAKNVPRIANNVYMGGG